MGELLTTGMERGDVAQTRTPWTQHGQDASVASEHAPPASPSAMRAPIAPDADDATNTGLAAAVTTTRRTGHERAPWLSPLDLAEGGLLVDVGVILDLASIYLPIVGNVLSPAVPTPFAVLFVRRGARATLLAAGVATFLVTVLAGPHFGWRMGLQALVGMLLGWAMRRRFRPLGVLTLGTALVATASFAATLGVIAFFGLPVELVVGGMRNSLRAAAYVADDAAGWVHLSAQWAAVRPAFLGVAFALLRVWPVLVFLYVTVFALPVVILYYAVANLALRTLGHDVRPFPPGWLGALARFSLLLASAPITVPLWLVGLLTRGRVRRRDLPEGER